MKIHIRAFQIEDYSYVAWADGGLCAFGLTEESVVSNICTQLERLFGADICATKGE